MKAAVADAVLVQRTLSGDLEGFGELHRRYYRKVFHIVLGIVRDRVQAEDTAQEAYLSALRELPRLADPGRFYPWLCRIAVNRAIEELRKATRRARWTNGAVLNAGAEVETASTEQTVLDDLVSKEQRQRVRAALHHLPEGQRAAVILRFFDGLSMKHIAEILGCEEVTARTQVFRGLRRLGVLLRQGKVSP